MTGKRWVLDWWFRDRRTGRVVVAQPPNATLWIWLVSIAIRILVDPSGTSGTTIQVVGVAALVAWALDEIVRGVNPWRRALGLAVLAGQVVALVAS